MSNLYYSLKDYYKKKFGGKIYKITLDAGFTCPNRDGSKGYGGCIYCDAKGSGNGASLKKLSLKEQIIKGKEFLRKRYKAEKFFLYFQAFTNTYGSPAYLKKVYDEAIQYGGDDIVGIIIGTRPDCIDIEKLELISSYTKRYEVWIEYGLQSIHQKSLDFINRCHTLDDYIDAVELTKKFPIKITTHIILGLPVENREEMLETVKFIANFNKIDAIKIHSLYIPKDSRLAYIYKKEKFSLFNEEEYVKLLADAIEILPPDLIIARLTGETSKENLVAPLWVLNKQKVINDLIAELKKRDSFQGKFYEKK